MKFFWLLALYFRNEEKTLGVIHASSKAQLLGLNINTSVSQSVVFIEDRVAGVDAVIVDVGDLPELPFTNIKYPNFRVDFGLDTFAE